MDEKIEGLTKYVEYLGEEMNKLVKYSEYLASNLNSQREYIDFIAQSSNLPSMVEFEDMSESERKIYFNEE